MLSLKKAITRHTRLLPVLVFLLLAQIQQALACELMTLAPAQAGQLCSMHDSATPLPDQKQKFCCEFAFAYSTSGNLCHSDPGTIMAMSLWSNLDPDFQPDIMLAGPEYVLYFSSPPRLTYIPDRDSSRPGNNTYLITQRLRI